MFKQFKTPHKATQKILKGSLNLQRSFGHEFSKMLNFDRLQLDRIGFGWEMKKKDEKKLECLITKKKLKLRGAEFMKLF